MHKWPKAKASTRFGRIAIAVVIANEIRGIAVVCGVVWTFLHHRGPPYLG
jgi:hypothetical protein